MAPTCSAKDLSHDSEWSPVSIDTNTVTPSPTLSWSTTATRFSMTPSASSFWMRFQHGVDDSPTRCPISATESEASCCSTPSILRSIASIGVSLDVGRNQPNLDPKETNFLRYGTLVGKIENY